MLDVILLQSQDLDGRSAPGRAADVVAQTG